VDLSRPPIIDEDQRIETRLIFWSAIMIALFFVVFGIAFWLHTRWSLTTCVFARPDCSVAAATWTLVLITTFAFIAAYEAATKAGQALRISRQALEVEIKPVLGQWICNDKSHIPRWTGFIEDDELVMQPVKNEVGEFVPLEFDFQNLGRAALINVVVTLMLSKSSKGLSNDAKCYPVPLGNIGVEKEAHVTINMLWGAPSRPLIGWKDEAQAGRGTLHYSTLPFIEAMGYLEREPAAKRWKIRYIEEPAEKKEGPEPSLDTTLDSKKRKESSTAIKEEP
jgi:hypothetical protein